MKSNSKTRQIQAAIAIPNRSRKTSKLKHSSSIIQSPPTSPPQKTIQEEIPKDIERLNIVCEGPMFGSSKFAKAMRNIAFGLDKIGHNVKVNVHDTENVDYIYTEKGRRINKLTSNVVNKPYIHITMAHPDRISSHNDCYSIGYVMFEHLPDNISQHLATQNEIWTPSNFCKDLMVNNGLEKVLVMPLGVDTEIFHPRNVNTSIRVSSGLENMAGKYRFLSVMEDYDKKCVSTLVKTFAEEFSRNKDVALYIKSRGDNLGKAQEEIKDAINDISDPPLIHIDFSTYPDNVLAVLYKACNCFVLPTRGEGWGLHLTEAMSMEMPIIVTRWGGHLDFMNENNSYLINIDGTDSDGFAIPNLNHLKQLMRHVYKNKKDATQKGRKARECVLNDYTWEQCCDRIYDRLNNVSSEMKKE